MLNIIRNLVNKTGIIISLCITFVVVISGVFIRSNYNFLDYPYFEFGMISNVLYIFLAAGILVAYMYLGKCIGWNMKVAMGLYVLVSVLYILTVPLMPYSDMKSVYDIAANGLVDETGYLSVYNNQIPITVYLYLLMCLFGKSVLVPKIFNIIFNTVILFFVYKIYVLLNGKEKSALAIIWMTSPFLPVIMYVNHIYNDILFTMITVILIYIVLNNNFSNPMMCVMCFLSVLQYVIRPSGIIYIIAIAMYMILKYGEWKKCIAYIVVVVAMIVGITKINSASFGVNSDAAYPVWSYIQMGINEEEFGFQDGTHSSEWTLDDCVEKYKEIGLVGVLKIFAKKELWMWSEGTYQAQRYGFGDSVAEYERENFITKDLRGIDNSNIRNMIERISKGQYYIYMLLAFIGMINLRKDTRYMILFYLICGFFFFYLIWEIKSRYIYSLYPVFMVFAYTGLRQIINKLKKQH